MAVTKLGFDEKCHNTSLLNDFHKKSTIRTMALGFASYIYITDMFMFINMFIGTLIFYGCFVWLLEIGRLKLKIVVTESKSSPLVNSNTPKN